MSSSIKRIVTTAALAMAGLAVLAPSAGADTEPHKASTPTPYDLVSTTDSFSKIGTATVKQAAHTIRVGVEVDNGGLPAGEYIATLIGGNDLTHFQKKLVCEFKVDATGRGGCERTLHTNLLERGYRNEAVNVRPVKGDITDPSAVALIRFGG